MFSLLQQVTESARSFGVTRLSLLEHLLSLGLGPLLLLLIGLFVKFWMLREQDVRRVLRTPKDEKDYWEERNKIHEAYLKSMDDYDKRLLWASGGAFVVSFTAVQFLSGQQDFQSMPGSGIYLLLGWGLLVLAVIIQVGAPYASTRIFVQDKKAVIALYEDNDEPMAEKEKARSEAWGRLTRWANECAYFALLLALWYLTIYVYWNRPN